MLVGFVGHRESGVKDLPRICLIHSPFSHSSFFIFLHFLGIYSKILPTSHLCLTDLTIPKFNLPHS